LQEIRHPVM